MCFQKFMVGCMRAYGRKPCSATPSGKLKSKHTKAPPTGGFLISGYFQVLWREPLRPIVQDLGAAHHAPQRDVARADASENDAYLIRAWPDDRHETPVLNVLRGAHAVCPDLTNRLPYATVLLDGPRFRYDFESERQKARLHRSKSDFPAPDEPISARHSPAETSRLMGQSIWLRVFQSVAPARFLSTAAGSVRCSKISAVAQFAPASQPRADQARRQEMGRPNSR